mmetsp:Transcript_39280/g.59965  ORF Transcript_39280/g.59965 Transcript_39280/m.59965 type:complete len:201 (-) Transcript_39280:558-1160(-)
MAFRKRHSVHVFSDEEVGLFLRRREVSLLLVLQEPHLLVVRGSENLFVLSFFGELRREDLVLNVAVGPDVRDRQGHSLVHHLGIEVLALDFLLFFAREQLDGVWVREAGHAFLSGGSLQVILFALDLFVDNHGREGAVHVLFELGVGFFPLQRDRVAGDDHHVHVFESGDEPEGLLLLHKIVTEVQVLQLDEVRVLVEHF